MAHLEKVLDNKLLLALISLLILGITILSVYVFITGGDFISTLDAIY